MTRLNMTKHYSPPLMASSRAFASVRESLYFDGHEWIDFSTPLKSRVHRLCIIRLQRRIRRRGSRR